MFKGRHSSHKLVGRSATWLVYDTKFVKRTNSAIFYEFQLNLVRMINNNRSCVWPIFFRVALQSAKLCALRYNLVMWAIGRSISGFFFSVTVKVRA